MSKSNLLILLAVLLPPAALDVFGALIEERTISTPYGAIGPLALRAQRPQLPVWIQPYTGSPMRTDPRATIYAAKQLGVQQVLIWDRAVALNPLLQRGHTAVVTDYLDWTRRQPSTFVNTPFSSEPSLQVVHRPAFCPHLTAALHHILPGAVDVLYLGVDGPRRETPAEGRLFRSWGADVLGQNLVPEVALAQEAGLCYAGLITVNDFAADRPPAEPHGELRTALVTALQALPAFMEAAAEPSHCDCAR